MGENIRLQVEQMAVRAKSMSHELARLPAYRKDEGLVSAADRLLQSERELLSANAEDVKRAREKGMKESLVDRLLLNESRIEQMAEGIKQVARLDNPVGAVREMKIRPNGLQIGKKRVPLGVIGIIYESRPNVTADAFALCFKTGNVTVLRGGSDAFFSNRAIVKCLKEGLREAGIDTEAVFFIDDPGREAVKAMLHCRGLIDVVIPRGGRSLIQMTVQESTVPVIETGTGNCHIFLDESADPEMAVSIVVNAKTQRYGVCNACESLVVHEKAAGKLIPLLYDCLHGKGVEIRGDERAVTIQKGIVPATEEDWGMEYLDAVVSLKVVGSIKEAVAHINRYNTGHSETIVTQNYANAMQFQDEVDAAAVYINASTRFTDGYEFGFGAEIGISTQKLHARGPMGLTALTTEKYIIFGNGQIRE